MNHISIEASRALADHLGIPQEDDPIVWRRSLARQLEDMLDRQLELIALLDLMDGDPDVEDDDPAGGDVCDEPHDEIDEDGRDISWPERGPQAMGGLWGTEDDEDSDPDHGIDDVPHDDIHMEAEPSLGWPEDINAKDGGTFTIDGEMDADDEPDSDDEPDHRGRAYVAKRRAQREAGKGTHKGLFHGLDPNHLPERYLMKVEGDCLDPEIKDGARLEFSSTERPVPGDFVVIYRNAAFVKPGGWHAVVKRLVLDVRRGDFLMPRSGKRGVIVDMLNPPRRLEYPVEEVMAVHKVVRIVPADEYHPKMTYTELMEAAAQAAKARKVPSVPVTEMAR